MDVLIAKHAAGVDVRLVLDKTQAASASAKPLVAKLQASGIPLETGGSRKGHIMHLKIMVVDGRDTLSGSYNFTHTAALEENVIDIVRDDPARAAHFTKVWQEIWDHMAHKSYLSH